MAGLGRDLRRAWRVLRTSPLFTAAAVLILALGIGANATIYSLVQAVLLEPLPFAEPSRLVDLSEKLADQPDRTKPVSVPNFFDWRAQNRSFEGLAAYYRWQFSLTGRGEPERLWVGLVTASLFPVLEVKPVLGRGFTAEEDAPGGPPVVLLGHSFWQRRFGGSAAVVGDRLILDSKPHTIVGVLPAGFEFPQGAQLWVPLAYGPDSEPRGFAFLNVVGRLRDGSTLEEAAAEMAGIGRRLAAQYPDTNGNRSPYVQSLRDRLVGDVRRPLYILSAAVLLVLLIACANLINLLLARQYAAAHETLVRSALGASRFQLVRPTLAEGLLLGLLGGAGGLLLASGAVRLLIATGPQKVPRLAEAGLGVWGVVFSLVLALAAGFVSASVAAARASRSDLATHLNATGRGLKGGPAGTWLRRTLAVSEVALSLLLLIGAGLLLKSLASLQEVDLGFDPSGVLTFQVELPEPRYPEDHQPPAFYARLYERLGALPGVESAGGIFLAPLSGMNASTRFTIEGRPQGEGEPQRTASLRPVSPEYFPALRIPLRRGRLFNAGDRAGSAPVVVINEAAARELWPGENPIGRRVVLGADFGTTGKLEEAAHEVVGVVGDVRQAGPAQEEVPALYFPHLQSSWRMMTLVVRSSSGPDLLVPSVRREVWALDRDLPISEVKTLDQMLAESLSQSRFYALLVGSFALLALVLALVGVYGVVACSVGERTHEIGVRMALGAGRGTVVRMILKEALSLTLAGVALGLGAAMLLTRFLSSLLFGVAATDRPLFLAASLALVAAALAASYLPVRRALRLTPMTVLSGGNGSELGLFGKEVRPIPG